MFVDASDMPDCSSALIYSTWFIYCLQTVSTSNFIILPFFFFMRCKHRRTQAVLAFCRSVANAFASILCIGPLGHTCTSIYIYIYVCTSISARSSRTAFTRIVIYTWRRSVASVVSFVLFAVRFFLFAQIAQTAAHFCWFLYSSFIFLWQILGLPSFFLTFFLFFFSFFSFFWPVPTPTPAPALWLELRRHTSVMHCWRHLHSKSFKFPDPGTLFRRALHKLWPVSCTVLCHFGNCIGITIT